MNPRAWWWLLPWSVSFACAAEPDTGLEERYAAAQRCETADGSFEVLDFVGLSEWLADDDRLAEATGLDSVETCEQAVRTLATQAAVLEAEPSSDGSGSESSDPQPPQELGFRIRGGTEGGHAGAVELLMQTIPNPDEPGLRILTAQCSGILVGPAAVVTAAHCLGQFLSAANPADETTRIYAQVNYRKPNASGEQVWECLTKGVGADQNTGKCGVTSRRIVAATMHGPFVGSGDTQSDIGVLVNIADDWDDVDSDDYVRLWEDSLANFGRFEGWGAGYNSYAGTGEGVMRTGGFGLDWYHEHHFYALARTPRLCRFDSGGPAIWDDTGLSPYALGIASNIEHSHSSTGNCATEGLKQRYTRLSTKIDWIESVIAATRPLAPDCDTYFDAIIGGQYRRCW